MLTRILGNLLTHAIKFTPKDGCIDFIPKLNNGNVPCISTEEHQHILLEHIQFYNGTGDDVWTKNTHHPEPIAPV